MSKARPSVLIKISKIVRGNKLQLDLNEIPELYKRYRWSDRHSLWGYRPDEFPDFDWISSLERRFANLPNASVEAPVYLIREMIHWGGSQNGVLEKFELQLGTYNLTDAFKRVQAALPTPEHAISAALEIPGIGLSYASKLLRFLCPETYGALDSQIRQFLLAGPKENWVIRKIYDGKKSSMVKGYVDFIEYLAEWKISLEDAAISRPGAVDTRLSWRASDIEMALFQKSLEHKTERQDIPSH